MDNPFLYLTLNTMRNSWRVRLRRLRQPRYAIALLLGIAYFTLILGRPFFFGNGSGDADADEISTSAQVIAPAIGSVVLFALLALPWIFPSKQRAALAVTQAEVQFLFTAPLSRRRLIRYKLLRSMVGALISSAFLTIVMRPDSVAQALARFLGTALIIALINLHYTGISLHRLPSATTGPSTLIRRWLPSALVLTLIALVVRDLMARWPDAGAVPSGDEWVSAVAQLSASGLTGIVLWPFRAIVALPLADSATAFALALPVPLIAIALNYLWIIRTDVPFEEASAELADKIARVRKEGLKALRTPRAATPTPFSLAPSGLTETAILWKNLITMRRSLSLFMVMPFLPFVIVIAAMMVTDGGNTSRADTVTGMLMIVAGMTVVLGPMMLRTDLRQDLPNLAILRTWPVRGAALVRGQVLAPAIVLSAVVWIALVAALSFSMLGSGELQISQRLSYFLAAATVAPGVILVQLLIQNGLAVTFPSWVTTGPPRGGVDAIGQRMLLMLVGVLGLLLGILPALLLGGSLALVVRFATGEPSIVASSIVAAAVLIGEAALGSELVGSILDRTDVSALDPVDS